METQEKNSIALKGIVVIVGNYGSGKTEISINLAMARRRDGLAVSIADLDLVNPYFRTREARDALEAMGIRVVMPEKKYHHADLPILSPAVAGLIRQPAELTLLDAGGDDAGATVLASLADHFATREGGPPLRVLQVINPMRPFTDTIEGCARIRREIEAAAKLRVNGVAGNANLLDDTSPEHISEGYDFVRSVSAESGLPLEFITAPSTIMDQLDIRRFACPVLTIHRRLTPPWKKPAAL